MEGLIIIVLIVIGIIGFLIYMKRSGRGGRGGGGFGGGKKKCGYCRAWVKYNAPYCPKCGYEFIVF